MHSSLTSKTHIYKRLAAFTLLEMTIVIAIIGVIVAGGLAVLTVSTQTSLYNATTTRMDQINKALLDYTVAFGRLPCPSNLTLTSTNTNYGVEAASNNNTCTGLTPAANFTSSTGAAEGGVPTRTLKLPDNYMYDGWGRRFRYAVDPAQTASGSFPPAMAGGCGAGYASAITVKDASGASRTTAAAYVLISHGANGHGAYTSNGVVFNAGSVNSDEQTNCHCDNTGTSTTYTGTYVEKLPTTTTTTNDTGIFDDIVSFREAWQLQNATTTTSSACQYLYVSDTGNNRTQIFNESTGAYIGQFAASGSTTTDPSGNVYIITGGQNGPVAKYTSTGTFISYFMQGLYSGSWGSGIYGSGNGHSEGNWGVASDFNGNIYVSDQTLCRTQKFNSSGQYLKTFGGDKGDGTHTCSQCASTTSCTCYCGTAAGQWSGYNSMRLDSTGNLYMGNQQFNSSGSYVQTYYNYNGVNGQSNSGVAVTSSGSYVYADIGNGQTGLQEWNAVTGTAVTSFGTSSGSANGQFINDNTVGCGACGIVIDSSGNLWVADAGNNRVQEFTSSGTFMRAIGAGYMNAGGTVGSSGTGPGQFHRPDDLAISFR